MPHVNRSHLEVRNLACRRGGRLLFERLSFAASDGALVGVSGPNGAGKTSLLRLLAGLGLAECGDIAWRGRAIADARPAFNADLAWLGHADGLKGELTPRENLTFHRALVGTGGAATDVDAAVAAFGLVEVADRPCRLLSAGQRRRAALARLRVAAAPLWILDEPMASLDIEGQRLVDQLISAHCTDGGIAVVTSHQAFASARTTIDVVIG